ncbi:MAG: hypothetical protein ABI451_00235 [Dokdonella sp.]
MPSRLLLVSFAGLAATAACRLATAANPFIEWRDRLFDVAPVDPPLASVAADESLVLGWRRAQRFLIDAKSPEGDFPPTGRSHYRLIELPREVEHVAIRLQVLTTRQRGQRGNTMFKPIIHVWNDDGHPRPAIEVKPLLVDIRPFRRTRLLACMTMDNVRRFAIVTDPSLVGKYFESAARDKVEAPTKDGFYYSTGAVKLHLPFAAFGEMVIEATPEKKSGEGC